MKIAMIGTRGVPARYGGFETAVEEVGRRLVERGHQVTVYCRSVRESTETPLASYHGMDLVHLPATRRRSLETLSHTALSVRHLLFNRLRFDVVLIFNAANSVFLPLLRLRRLPAATHVDGLEWRRGKWGTLGRGYYRMAESLSVRWSDALIADAVGIREYYWEEFHATSDLIGYGAPIIENAPTDRLAPLGLKPGGYHLVVARFEPENNVDLAIEGYLRSGSKLPFVVVGSAPYVSGHVRRIEELAAEYQSVRLMGGVWDQQLLDQMYAHAVTYVHGHSVGGTNPSLLRAMGAGAPVLAYDVSFNRDVLDRSGRFFDCVGGLAAHLSAAEMFQVANAELGRELQRRAKQLYTWERVADEYEKLCFDLMTGRSQRGLHNGRRNGTLIRRNPRRPATIPPALRTQRHVSLPGGRYMRILAPARGARPPSHVPAGSAGTPPPRTKN